MKADAEFIGGKTIQACLDCGMEFIFANKRCSPVFKAQDWYCWGDYGYNETMYQPNEWKKACRFVVMRIRKDQIGERQLELFPDDEYTYRIFATNLSWRPHAVIKRYDTRASVESLIKEAQQEGILAIPSRRFLSNHAFFQIVMLAYNIWRWIKLVAGIRPETENIQTDSVSTNPGVAPGEEIVNHTIRIARLKMLFLAAKITSHERKTVVKYSEHDARAEGLLDFMAYLDKKRQEPKPWECSESLTSCAGSS